MKLSRITKVNPREVWKHEAHDFTQWLVKKDNISILAEELELSLDNVVAEAAAGFSSTYTQPICILEFKR